VHITSDRRYRLPAPPEEVWAALSVPGDYPSWWPWLQRLEAPALAEGASWACQIQPPVPYPLRFTLVLTEVVPASRVAATLSGDVVGSARLTLDPAPGGTAVRLTSALAPGSPALRAVALVARPLARFGHDWVLDTGARQFVDRALAAPARDR
jgi:uncharacterized protein YndB with AHSA1/START domain